MAPVSTGAFHELKADSQPAESQTQWPTTG